MKKIFFDDKTYIWIKSLDLVKLKSEILRESYIVVDSKKDTVKTDGYGYREEWKQNINFIGKIDIKNNLDLIHQEGINACKEIYENDVKKEFNKINTDAWINIVRSKNPVQIQFKHEEIKGVDKFHTHTEINQSQKKFYPHYTFVYYIQMPDVMENEDGVLYIKGWNDKEYFIRPKEDELIIMPGSIPHAPNNAPKSTIDRIVMAGNVGFEFIKKEKSFI